MLRSARKLPLVLVTLSMVSVGSTSALAATPWSDPPGDVGLPNADLLSGSASVGDGFVDLRWQTAAPPWPSTATYDVHWCIDMDRNPSTGSACGSGSGADAFIRVRGPVGALEQGRLSLLGLTGLDTCSMLSFDPAANTFRVLAPLSSFGGDGDFDYNVLVSFGGSGGNGESSGIHTTASEGFDAWSGTSVCELRSLDVAPSAMAFVGVVSEADPPAQTLSINDRGVVSNWTASTSADWLSVDPPTGSTPADVSVSASSFGLPPGIYSDQIIITGDGAGSPPPPVTVTLSVVESVSLVEVRSFSTERFGRVVSIAYDPLTNRLWLADGGGGNSGDTIVEVTNRGRRISSFSSDSYGGTDPTGIGVDPATGDLWIADNIMDTLFRVSRSGVQLSAFLTNGSSLPSGVSVEPDSGELFTSDGGGAPDELFVWTTDGIRQQSFDLNPLGFRESANHGLVFDPETAHLFMTDLRDAWLFEIDTRAALAQIYDLAPLGIERPSGVALDPLRRRLWVVDEATDRVVELAFEGTGQPYAIPVPLDVDPASCADPLSLSQDTLTVAVAGSPEFDVRDIDAAKVRLEGVEPVKKSRSDQTSPTEFTPPGAPLPACPAPDGQLDSVFKFSAPAVVDALESRLGRALVPGERVVLNLTAKLRNTERRAPIRGMGWADVME